MTFLRKIFEGRKARKERNDALQAFAAAKARRDTRSIHAAQKRLKEATNRCLRLGV